MPESGEPTTGDEDGAASIDASDMIDDAEITPIDNSNTPLEIIRNEIDAMVDPEQLNLF